MNENVQRNRRRPTEDGIAVTALYHGFEEESVLEDVTLGLDRGEILAVIGPSGTGKTTLLELLSAFYPPDSGTIRIGDGDVWSLSERDRLAARRRLGVVFQRPNLFDTTVRRNVCYGRHVRRGWRDRLREWRTRLLGASTNEAVNEALATVGLGDAGPREARSLSGGEAQRVAFARALAYDPDFLLLDEPTSDLDPRNTAVIESAVETARTRGIGVAVATHDMHQAERLADRVAVLIEGELIEVGPTDRVFAEPNDSRTRRFIDGELVYAAGEIDD